VAVGHRRGAHQRQLGGSSGAHGVERATAATAGFAHLHRCMHKSGRVGRPNQMKSSCSGWPSWRSGNVTCGRLTLPSRRAAVRCALGVSTVAGTVVRYGHPRRLAQWPRGRTLVQCTLGVASRLRVDDVQSIQTKRRRRSMRVVFGGVVEEGCARCLSLPTSHPLSRPPGLGSGLGGLPALKPDNPNPNQNVLSRVRVARGSHVTGKHPVSPLALVLQRPLSGRTCGRCGNAVVAAHWGWAGVG
jgi:hypothetical protein